MVPASILHNVHAMKAVDFVRPVLTRLCIPILTAPPPTTGAPGDATADVEKRGIYIYGYRKYAVNGSTWLHLAFDIMHEVAHLAAAEGDTVHDRQWSIDHECESNGVLQLEARFWTALGKRWEWFRNRAVEDFSYDLDEFESYAFDSRETRGLVKRGLLTPERQIICWNNVRDHIHQRIEA